MFARRSLLLIVLVSLAVPASLVGQEPAVTPLKPGDHVRVRVPRLYTDPIIGDIEALSPDTLMLAVTARRTIALPLADIKKIEKSVESGGLGLTGAVLGGLAGAVLFPRITSCKGVDRATAYYCGILGAFGGLVVGGLVAGPSNEWVEVSLRREPLGVTATVEVPLQL